MNNNSKGLFGYILKYKVSLLLSIILFFLIKQNIFENNFPNVILQKQSVIKEIENKNINLQKNNALLFNQITNYTEEDMSLIESKARYKYGLVKEGEVFFKVNKIINNDNLVDSSISAL